MHFKFALFATLAVAITVCCTKDFFQAVLHPSIETRFADSTSPQIPKPQAPAVGADFRFAVFSDIHLGQEGSRLVDFAPQVTKEQIDFLVILGDLTDNGTEAEYNEVKRALDQLGVPYLTTVGNHDLFQGGTSGGWKKWKATFGPATYSVEVNSAITFMFLDTASGNIGKSQFAWLDRELKNAKTPIKIVGSHYSIHDGFTPTIWRLESVEERYKFTDLLLAQGVFAYFGGHVHGYRESSIQGLAHFSVGSMYPHDLDYGDPGYALFSYTGGKLTWARKAL